MIAARAALSAVLLAAATTVAHAQADTGADVPATLRPPIAAYRSGDLRAAEVLLRPLAASNPDAEAWLGAVLLDQGLNKEALRLLQHAADAGSSEGQHRLALVFAEGLGGTPRNETLAAELFEKAATAGHQRAMINIGILYLRGQGVPRDLVQARAWLEKAAAKDDPYALYALGRAMERSDGPVLGDPVRAADLYRRAAEKGHPFAALRYGLALLDGAGVKKDPTAAQHWLIQAQRAGVPEAALALGDMLVRTPANRDKAANQKVVALAIGWYESAAEAGVASAQFKLGNAYFAGAGVTRDSSKALYWYDRAARQGLAEAQHTTGIILTGGVAGSPDAVEGYKWLILAERGGNPDSRAVREKARDKLSAADLKRAEALAQSFKPQPERTDSDLVPRLVLPQRQ
jgi:TPR repeat protein